MHLLNCEETVNKHLLNIIHPEPAEEGNLVKRAETVALLKELGAMNLLQPSWVLVEQRKPEKYQLCVKGYYDFHRIEVFIQKYALAIEEDMRKGLICIFKP